LDKDAMESLIDTAFGGGDADLLTVSGVTAPTIDMELAITVKTTTDAEKTELDKAATKTSMITFIKAELGNGNDVAEKAASSRRMTSTTTDTSFTFEIKSASSTKDTMKTALTAAEMQTSIRKISALAAATVSTLEFKEPAAASTVATVVSMVELVINVTVTADGQTALKKDDFQKKVLDAIKDATKAIAGLEVEWKDAPADITGQEKKMSMTFKIESTLTLTALETAVKTAVTADTFKTLLGDLLEADDNAKKADITSVDLVSIKTTNALDVSLTMDATAAGLTNLKDANIQTKMATAIQDKMNAADDVSGVTVEYKDHAKAPATSRRLSTATADKESYIVNFVAKAPLGVDVTKAKAVVTEANMKAAISGVAGITAGDLTVTAAAAEEAKETATTATKDGGSDLSSASGKNIFLASSVVAFMVTMLA